MKREGIILFNTTWRVGEGNERLCYKMKEFEAKLKLPKWLPQSHAAAIRWFREHLRAFQKIDITKGLVLVEWLRVIENSPMGIHKRDIIQKLHDDAQGIDLLDRYWGSECYGYIRDSIFGVEMAAYFQWCEENRCAPSGRACAAMVTHRFRKRPDAARITALKALWAIKCNANSFQNVAFFVSKVRLAFQHLCVGDIYDEEYAYDWLWQNLKDFAGIKKFVDKIISARDDPRKAYRRTWNYLGGVTKEVLSHKKIDANDENYVKSFIADMVRVALMACPPIYRILPKTRTRGRVKVQATKVRPSRIRRVGQEKEKEMVGIHINTNPSNMSTLKLAASMWRVSQLVKPRG